MTKPDSLPEGTEESANSKGSENGSNQTGRSEPQYVTVEEFNRLNQGIEALRRSMQSEKDKGVKKVAAEVGELRQILQGYSDKSVGDVLADLNRQEEQEARQAMLDFARMMKQGSFPGGNSGGTESKGVDVSAVVKELELDESDTRVQAFRAKTFASETEAFREAAKLQKQILTIQPSDADQPSKEAKRNAPATNQAQLKQEYDQRSQKLYGSALLRLKREMRDKGLEIS